VTSDKCRIIDVTLKYTNVYAFFYNKETLLPTTVKWLSKMEKLYKYYDFFGLQT